MVVGGIVIMNIMLAVVTERTHEIGIRKSLGARRRDILNQYLVESAVLAATGGLAGVGIAWMVAVAGAQPDVGADGAAVVQRVHRRGPLGDGRAVLRHLPGAAGRQAGSHRSPAGGITMTKLAFTNGLVLAMQTIRSHKLRAFLTVLGVIIGTGTIIGVSAILTGFDAQYDRRAAQLRAELDHRFQIPRGLPRGNLEPRGAHPQEPDLRERPDICASGARAWKMSPRCCSPIAARSTRSYKGNDMYDVNLIGVEEGYAAQRAGGHARWAASSRDEESRRRMPVAVIGADIEKGLFANMDPIGKTITVDGHEFTVIGTMLRPAASFFGDTDNRVLLPYGTMQKMYPNARENAIVVTAERQTAAGAGRSPHGAAHRPPRACTTNPTISRSPPPNRWSPISARSPR